MSTATQSAGILLLRVSKKRFLWAPVNKRVVQERALWCTEQDRRLERANVHISHLRYQNHCLPVAVAWAPVLAVEIPVDRPLPLLAALWHGVLFVCVVIICGWWSFPGRFLLRWNLQETTQTAPRSLRNQEPWWRNSYIFTVFVLLLVLTPETVTSIYNVKGVEREIFGVDLHLRLEESCCRYQPSISSRVHSHK